MKQKIALLLVLILAVSAVFSSCKKNEKNNSSMAGSGETLSEITSELGTESDIESGLESDLTSDTISDTSGGGAAANNSKTSSKGSSASNFSGNGNSTEPKYQNMTFSTQAVEAERTVANSWKVQDLCVMQLEGYPIDTVYDWGHSIIKVGNTYKMWWTRACPFDTIWYAESTDMKNWTNCQKIIEIDTNTEWIKEMLGWSDVVYVNGQYYMFFEAPCRIGSTTEFGNNVFLAMSKDGKNFTMYPNNSNPQPIIKSPVIKEGVYGVGQPDAFYKDGYFYIAYTDSTGQGDCTRLAVSEKDRPWKMQETNVYKHQKIINIAGASVRYNSKTNKYYCGFATNPNLFFSNMKRNSNIYVMETSDLSKWPYNDLATAVKALTPLNNTKVYQRSNIDFAVNPQGIIDTETMYLIYKMGDMPSDTEDHRNTHETWDGYVMAVNPKEFLSKAITLPNGKTSNAANLKAYSTTVAKWVRPSVTAVKGAPKVDGVMEDAWKNATVAKVETVTAKWSSGCDPTDTTADVRFMWDAGNLYVYANVKDKVVSTSAKLDKPENIWRKDGIDLFIDVNNNMVGGTEVTLTPMSYVVSLCADGTTLVKDNRDANMMSEYGKKITSVVKKVSGGYVVEAAIPWYDLVSSQIKSGKEIAIDIAINDDQGSGDRDSIVFWSDYQGESFRYLDRFGKCLLK